MGHSKKQPVSARNLSAILRIYPLAIFVFTLLAAVYLSGGPALSAMDISDEPMMAQIKAAPANIMIVLDDSGSMTFEVLIAGYYDGRYPNPAAGTTEGYCYIYDYLGDNAYTDALRYMESEGRKYWQAQYYGVNVMYYNPNTTYEPWPDYPGQTFPQANTELAKPHPLKTSGITDLDLDAESYTVTRQGGPNLAVKHAHYYDQDDNGEVWLVVIDGDGPIPAIKYYLVTQFDGSGLEQKVKKVEEKTPPSEIVTGRSYGQERQNFANWFTYHRRREYVAKSAIARVINNLRGVRVGILGINGKIIVPLKPLGVWKGGTYYDQRNDLLSELYDYDSRGGTPLREGLNDVGNYYKSNSATLTHFQGSSATGAEPPYYSEADGGACQQSFTIVMTDGYYSRSQNPGVGNADGDNSSDWDGDNNGFYTDGLSETLADVAMYYYENDLNTNLPDMLNDPERLNPSALDTARHQHMVTFGVAFGVTGNLDPDDYNDDPISADFMECTNSANCTVGQYPDWPSSISVRSKETIDDLFHATVNGRGDFLTAKDPRELAESLLKLMNNILARLGSASAVSINGDSLYGKVTDEVLIFQASYTTTDWSGNVKAFGVDTSTGRVLTEDPKWKATDSLAAKLWTDRNILSYDGSSGIEFDPSVSTSYWSAILGSDYENIINYVSGQNDISGFRVRNTLLGDIIHSSPVFEDYGPSKKDYIFVGANDGMLHAFEMTVTDVAGNKVVTGDEKFAYVPSFVQTNLVKLTEPAMTHKFFVDLTPTIATGTGLLGGSNEEKILVGGLGKGGKGLYALDITDPENMSTDDVLWEFPDDATSGETPDMGYSYSKPIVVQTNSTTADEGWVVIVGNGYDSPNGRSVLYLLNPSTGAVTKKILTLDSDTNNGLSSPIAVDVNYDRKVDFVYAGDLKGNMWKFDLTGDSSSKWSVAYYDAGSSSNAPLFQAKRSDGTTQPITTKPEVTFHPQKDGFLVLFGTGKFLGQSDFTDERTQTIYGIWDYGDRIYYPGAWGDYSNDDDSEFVGAFNRPELSSFVSKDVRLLEQTATAYPIQFINVYNQTIDTQIRVLTDNQPNWYTKIDTDPLGVNGNPNLPDLAEDPTNNTAHAGWFWDLPLDGERVVSDSLLRDGRLIVICFTPNPDPCSDGGSSFLMELNSFTGGSTGGTIFDINNDGKIDEDDWVAIGSDGDGNVIKVIPDGLKLAGNVQPPAILQLNPRIEVKYLSSSIGAVHIVKEVAVRLGVTYWKELDKDLN